MRRSSLRGFPPPRFGTVFYCRAGPDFHGERRGREGAEQDRQPSGGQDLRAGTEQHALPLVVGKSGRSAVGSTA